MQPTFRFAPRGARAVVIAIGGNALIAEGQQGTIDEQFGNARDAAREVAGLVEDGWRVVVTHGNGPQVGFILLRSEMLNGPPFIPKLTLDMCVADSEGGIGYIVGNSLSNEFGRRGLNVGTVCVLTQTVVDARDPAAWPTVRPAVRPAVRWPRPAWLPRDRLVQEGRARGGDGEEGG